MSKLREALERAPEVVPDMVVSVMAANTMGSAWFDGVTPVMGPPRWTHVWEQGFPSLDALEPIATARRPRPGSSAPAGSGGPGGVVKRAAELFYEVLAG